jgi:curved DNA-binding protein CbpA
MSFKDYYKVLQIPRTASLDQIKKAYRSLALSLHPDVTHGDKKKEIQFKEVVEAFETLSDTALRSLYDSRFGIGSPGSRFDSTSSYSRRTSTSYRPTAKSTQAVSSEQFNMEVWNAWHYGDNAVVSEAVKQTRSWMEDERSPHKSYYEKKAVRQSQQQGPKVTSKGPSWKPSTGGMKKDEDGKDCVIS